MLHISFRAEPQFISAMRTKGVRIVQTLSVKISALMFLLQSKVQSDFLSGQALHVVTGKLRGSIEAHPTKVEGTKLIGEVCGAGGPAFYGKFFETGTSRTYEIRSVKARALHFLVGGKERFAASVSHPPLPARPFMQPALDALSPTIISELNEAVNKVINEKE